MGLLKANRGLAQDGDSDDGGSAAHGSLATLGAGFLEVVGGGWDRSDRRAGQVGNPTDVGGAALSLGVHKRRASGVGGAATAVAATTTTTIAAAAAASGGNGNGERGHEGDEESGQLHVGGGKTQRLNSNGVSVWLKTEGCW